MRKSCIKLAVVGSLVGAVAFGTMAHADSVGDIVNVSALNLFAPVGFDDNDETVVVLDGYLPNSCYKVADPEIIKDLANKSITVQPKARFVGGICLMALIPYSTEVKLGVLPKGDYSLVTNRGSATEALTVAASTTAGPDDFLYAPVDSVSIEKAADGTISAVLQGRFTNSCMQWKENKIFYTGKTIQLLPVIEMSEVDCQEMETPFRQVVPLNDMQPGRYLLHVRSLNGASVNNVFPVFESGDPIW